jgi:hypothetical protein
MKQGNIIYGDDGTHNRPLKCTTAGYQIIGNEATIQTELYAASTIAASVMVKSNVASLIGAKQATIFIDHGRGSTAAFGALGGTNYIIQGSQKASGNDTWVAITTIVASSAACSSALSSGAVSAAATSIVILSGTAFVVNDNIMWANTADMANSTEWAVVSTVTGTASFTVLDPLTNAQGSTVVITNGAQRFVYNLNCESLTRARVVINNTAGTTAAIRSRIAIITS